LIKVSQGVAFKTWEGEISQNFWSTDFTFSVMDSEEKVIADLKRYGRSICSSELCGALPNVPWWGDTPYYCSRKKSKLAF
jgi:hypothetical protein